MNHSHNAGYIKVPGAPYVIRSASQSRSYSNANLPAHNIYGPNEAADRNKGRTKQAELNGSFAQTADGSARPLKDNRGVIKLFLLSLITLGIYNIYFISRLAKDLNIACEYDGKKTRGVIALVLLSIITFGIYPIIWQLSVVSRIDYGARHYGVKSSISLISYILWNTIGAIICGSLIAAVKMYRTMNRLCAEYNSQLGF